jgi:NADP-dependent 3-hydroxy acid dehydrogenase YdfG
VTVIEPGAVATELTDHITHAGAKQMAEGFYERSQSRLRTSPRSSRSRSAAHRVPLNEILIPPTAQA